tara:strand:- start:133 stop:1350 length:1218 start_codon:yes stop_codon:yes gene_type:complete
MAVHGGPGIITDGLVLCLDKYDEDSYAGEPTTNVLDSPLDLTNGSYWARGNNTAQSSWSTGHPDPFGGANATLFSSDADASYPHISQYGITNSTNSWTFSAWMKTVSGATTIELTCFRESPWAGNFGLNVYKTLTTSWQRFVMTGTPQDSSWGTFHIIRHASVAPAMSYLVAYPQAEENSHVTKFVDGSRSATDGWKDLSGNGNHADLTSLTYTTTSIPGTPRGGTPSSPVRGHYRNDFSFNGSSDYVSLGTPSSVDLPIGNNSRTVGVWFKANSGGSGQDGLIGWGSAGGTGYAWGLLINSNDTIGIACYGDDVFAGSVRDDTWHYCVATHDSSTGNRVLYLDGVSIATDSSTLNTADASARVGDWIGSHKFHGTIDVVEVYNRALSSTEVLQNFNAKRSRFGV